jgi:hypothetical protein
MSNESSLLAPPLLLPTAAAPAADALSFDAALARPEPGIAKAPFWNSQSGRGTFATQKHAFGHLS